MYYFKNNILKFSILKKYPSVKAGLSTKHLGNMGFKNQSSPTAMYAKRKNLFNNAGLNYHNSVFQYQMHTNNIKYVTTKQCGMGLKNEETSIPNNDGLITDKKNVILCVIVADCTPVYLYDTEHKVIALLHSGRKGTEQNIVKNAINFMKTEFQTNPRQILSILGPSIYPNHYQINREIAKKFNWIGCKKIENRIYLDIKFNIKKQLKNAGVTDIHSIDICTYEDENFYSYRQQGKLHGSNLGFMTLQ